MVKSKSIWSDQNHFGTTKSVLVTQKDKALVQIHCLLKQCFTRTFPRNQHVTVKLKSELLFTKFWYLFHVLADLKSICFTQRHLFQCCILIPWKCLRKTPFQHTVGGSCKHISDIFSHTRLPFPHTNNFPKGNRVKCHIYISEIMFYFRLF